MGCNRSVVLVAVGLGMVAVASCEGRETKRFVAELRARPASPLHEGIATAYESARTGLTPSFGAASEKPSARLSFPRSATGRVHIEDVASGARVGVALLDARAADARQADGYVVYRRGHASGATAMHRALPNGTEDFLSFESRPGRTIFRVLLPVGAREGDPG